MIGVLVHRMGKSQFTAFRVPALAGLCRSAVSTFPRQELTLQERPTKVGTLDASLPAAALRLYWSAPINILSNASLRHHGSDSSRNARLRRCSGGRDLNWVLASE